MSSSIYNVPAWTAATIYRKNDIVNVSDYIFYSTQNHTSGGSFTTDRDANLWGGYAVATDNGETKPNFFWTPSYNNTIQNTPKVKKMQFGDGYQQRTPDGINNILLNLDFSFDNRNNDEATAIIHFLTARRGVESFLFTPPPPYGVSKRFVCADWTDTRAFYNDISIKVKFEEVTN